MKKLVLSLLILFISLSSFSQKPPVGSTELRHIVLFTFKPSASKEELANVVNSFSALYGKVPQVKKFEWGMNMSPEHLDQGFTHCFMLTFSSEKDLAEYAQNPAHKAFQSVLKPVMDKVFVVDYWAKPSL